jgi:hypothetical protein
MKIMRNGLLVVKQYVKTVAIVDTHGATHVVSTIAITAMTTMVIGVTTKPSMITVTNHHLCGM